MPGLICLTVTTDTDTVWYSMVKVITFIMLSNCLGLGSSEQRVKGSPGGSRGWQISSTASSTFLVAGQSSPGCHHWIDPPLKYMMEIADVPRKTQLNTAFAKLVRCTHSTAYYVHGRLGVQSLSLLLGAFSIWEYPVLKIIINCWLY